VSTALTYYDSRRVLSAAHLTLTVKWLCLLSLGAFGVGARLRRPSEDEGWYVFIVGWIIFATPAFVILCWDLRQLLWAEESRQRRVLRKSSACLAALDIALVTWRWLGGS
jgi:hypothetical protein